MCRFQDPRLLARSIANPPEDHWNKWQGYSFYTWEMAIEKCVTVSYSLSVQPVMAFVGGLEFDLMPAPLASLDTTVCWPDKQPGGVDLSVLRSEIRTAGFLLFSRTLRLTKRFGDGTDFESGNTFGAHETWRNPIGIARGEHGVEDDRTLEPMSRTNLLQANESKGAQRSRTSRTTLGWQEETEDLFLASVEYGPHMAINQSSEFRGKAAAQKLEQTGMGSMRNMSNLQTGEKLENSPTETEAFELFSFKNPGMINFVVRGLLEQNNLELGMKIDFGPHFSSPEKRTRLINIVDQFNIVLTALPFVSFESKQRALSYLNGFLDNDLAGVVPPHVLLQPGSMIALHCTVHNRFLRMRSDGNMDGGGNRDFAAGIEANWEWERFTVVDAGNGQIALHSPRWNRFVMMGGNQVVEASAHKASIELPEEWTSERFTVVNAGDGQIALHNSQRNRFLRMSDGGHVDASSSKDADALPDSWTHERFRVLPVKSYLTVGSVVALHSVRWNRFLRMTDSHEIDRGDERAYDALPDNYHWERFTVVDAGNGQIGLFSGLHQRYVKMEDQQLMTASGLGGYEKFAVVPAGNGEIALHSTRWNRFVRMTGDGADGSSTLAADALPGDWNWERFRVLEVVPNPNAWSFQTR